MLNKNINTSKLKVKYILDNYSSLPGYPDAEDVIYELIREYSTKNNSELIFTDAYLEKRYSINKEKIANIIDILIQYEIITEVKESSSKKPLQFKTYTVIKNPYS